ncbi:hypothetical protein Esti_005979 [Eimeria stiedai]
MASDSPPSDEAAGLTTEAESDAPVYEFKSEDEAPDPRLGDMRLLHHSGDIAKLLLRSGHGRFLPGNGDEVLARWRRVHPPEEAASSSGSSSSSGSRSSKQGCLVPAFSTAELQSLEGEAAACSPVLASIGASVLPAFVEAAVRCMVGGEVALVCCERRHLLPKQYDHCPDRVAAAAAAAAGSFRPSSSGSSSRAYAALHKASLHSSRKAIRRLDKQRRQLGECRQQQQQHEQQQKQQHAQQEQQGQQQDHEQGQEQQQEEQQQQERRMHRQRHPNHGEVPDTHEPCAAVTAADCCSCCWGPSAAAESALSAAAGGAASAAKDKAAAAATAMWFVLELVAVRPLQRLDEAGLVVVSPLFSAGGRRFSKGGDLLLLQLAAVCPSRCCQLQQLGCLCSSVQAPPEDALLQQLLLHPRRTLRGLTQQQEEVPISRTSAAAAAAAAAAAPVASCTAAAAGASSPVLHTVELPLSVSSLPFVGLMHVLKHLGIGDCVLARLQGPAALSLQQQQQRQQQQHEKSPVASGSSNSDGQHAGHVPLQCLCSSCSSPSFAAAQRNAAAGAAREEVAIATAAAAACCFFKDVSPPRENVLCLFVRLLGWKRLENIKIPSPIHLNQTAGVVGFDLWPNQQQAEAATATTTTAAAAAAAAAAAPHPIYADEQTTVLLRLRIDAEVSLLPQVAAAAAAALSAEAAAEAVAAHSDNGSSAAAALQLQQQGCVPLLPLLFDACDSECLAAGGELTLQPQPQQQQQQQQKQQQHVWLVLSLSSIATVPLWLRAALQRLHLGQTARVLLPPDLLLLQQPQASHAQRMQQLQQQQRQLAADKRVDCVQQQQQEQLQEQQDLQLVLGLPVASWEGIWLLHLSEEQSQATTATAAPPAAEDAVAAASPQQQQQQQQERFVGPTAEELQEAVRGIHALEKGSASKVTPHLLRYKPQKLRQVLLLLSKQQQQQQQQMVVQAVEGLELNCRATVSFAGILGRRADAWALSGEEKAAFVVSLKEEGNLLFKHGWIAAALSVYKKGLDVCRMSAAYSLLAQQQQQQQQQPLLLPVREGSSPLSAKEPLGSSSELSLAATQALCCSLSLNAASCCLRLGAPREASNHCDIALACAAYKPQQQKQQQQQQQQQQREGEEGFDCVRSQRTAWIRKAVALQACEETEKALEAARAAALLCPEDKQTRALLLELQQKWQRERQQAAAAMRGFLL